MAKNSRIEWTHHTFNPWWGCAKVSPACKNCYAEAWANRLGNNVWGKRANRRFFSDKHWSEPVHWNRDAEIEGVRRRVFCASMADIFERRAELQESRQRLWDLMGDTPMLNWLVLTKRPHNIASMAPWKDTWPDNIWLGTTIENQHWANIRLPYLFEHKAKVRFVSCEPLLGEIDLSTWTKPDGKHGIDWVIAGGESGTNARPMNIAWARSLRDHCTQRNVAFHFKQWGHWAPIQSYTEDQRQIIEVGGIKMAAAGKKMAGRILDGQIWDEFPLSE